MKNELQNKLFDAFPKLFAQKNLDKKQTRYRDWETDRKSTRLNSSHRL